MSASKFAEILEEVREASTAPCECHSLDLASEECQFCMRRCHIRRKMCNALLEAPEVIAAYEAVRDVGLAHARMGMGGEAARAFEEVVRAGEVLADLAKQIAEKES